jgi:invasion protein IalB
VFSQALLGITLLIAFAGSMTPAAAQAPAFAAATTSNEPTLLLDSNDWQAFATGPGPTQVCYVTAASRARSALGKRDGRPTLYVTHRPGRQTYDVVAFAASYDFRRDSMARVAFANGATFRMFTDGNFAWAGDEAIDKRLVRAMAESASVTVTALGDDGHLHEDTLSLKGFGDAFLRASSECRRPGAPIKR